MDVVILGAIRQVRRERFFSLTRRRDDATKIKKFLPI